MTVLGYARVSTTGQTLEVQLNLLKRAGCERIFSEKASGATAARHQLERMMRSLSSGDVIVVTRLDRFARSARDLLNLVAKVQNKGVAFRSLAESLDIGTPIGQLTLTVMGAIAQFEREVIRERTYEGRARALVNGVVFGRKPKLDSASRLLVLARKAAGETQTQIARSYGVSPSTISRIKVARTPGDTGAATQAS